MILMVKIFSLKCITMQDTKRKIKIVFLLFFFLGILVNSSVI